MKRKRGINFVSKRFSVSRRLVPYLIEELDRGSKIELLKWDYCGNPHSDRAVALTAVWAYGPAKNSQNAKSDGDQHWTTALRRAIERCPTNVREYWSDPTQIAKPRRELDDGVPSDAPVNLGEDEEATVEIDASGNVFIIIGSSVVVNA